MKLKALQLVFGLLLMVNFLQAQSNLFIDDSYTVEEMVMDFFSNPNITVSNVTYSGTPEAVAFFDAGGTNLGVDAGIVFTSGYTSTIPDSANASESTTGYNGTGGDVDLDLISSMNGGSTSNDAAIIEFDFSVAESGTLNFDYVFGSEEYPEFVCTNFNDAFAFFVSGPGLNGPFSNNAENITTVPGTNYEVSINNINNGQFNNGFPMDTLFCAPDSTLSQYYIHNLGDEHIMYDGLTIEFPASFSAVGGETYHAKLVIADRGDSSFDSGIFLSFSSLGPPGMLLEPPTSFDVSIDGNTIEINNESKYARTYTWDFGNNQTSDLKDPGTITYDMEGTYTISLVTENYCCLDTFMQTVVIVNNPALVVSVETTNNPLACFGDENATINLTTTGGHPPYQLTWEPATPGFNPLGAGTYTYTIIDATGDVITGDVIIEQPDELTLDLTTDPEIDNQQNGSATVNPMGGTTPYAYEWSNGETTQTIENLFANIYTVTVTDANNCMSEIAVTVDFYVGLFENEQEYSLTIYPNPADDAVFVAYDGKESIQKVTVYDALGKKLKINYQTQGDKIKINLADHFAAGIYVIQISWDNGTISTGQFVKR